jgi:hypothetical protein
MDEEVDIVVLGFEVSDRLAEAGLTRVFGLNAQQARRFVRDVPLVAKRCLSSVTADRYVSALRSIGARVELRSPGDRSGDVHQTKHSSLPIPAPSVLAQVTESARIERETARAIARFRANEGLDPSAPGVEVDPVNPQIPKAPLVPRDLHRMPNARLPQFSDRPDWMLDDPLGGPGSEPPEEEIPHFDADPPPRPSAAPAANAPLAAPAKGTRSSPPAADGESAPASRAAIGLAHSATASVRPGLGSLSSWRPGAEPRAAAAPPRRRSVGRWLAAGVGVIVAVAAAAGFMLLDRDRKRLADAWRAEGVDPGEFMPAAWLEEPGHELRGASRAQLSELLTNLTREGAPAVYAVRIQETETGQRADALLIELPPSREARQMILWHAAKSVGLSPPLIPDRGQRIHVLEFPR